MTTQKNTQKKTTSDAQSPQHSFSAETGKILQMMIHSLYAQKDIFLRELISNASDASDKLKYEVLVSNSDHPYENSEIAIHSDSKTKTLSITDHGIGMDEQDMINNLGTIARSGTELFTKKMSESTSNTDGAADNLNNPQLIGQFGVGFYSAFMVADLITVTSRKLGDDTAWKFESDAINGYSVSKLADNNHPVGTTITLAIKEDAKEFLDQHRIKHIVRTYSDHIPYPITFTSDESAEKEVLNQGTALWTLPASEVSESDYTEFYRHVGHAGDEPWMTLHNKLEGQVSFTNLLFIPSKKPFDLYHPDRRTRVKLYVKRVFITDENIDLLPRHLRFMQGVVDSEDLPLNISRETLQHNAVIRKIKESVTSRVLTQLKKKAEKEPEKFAEFWTNFGPVLKEGLCEAGDAQREKLMDVCRFYTSEHSATLSSFEDYVGRMKEKQTSIYYAIGQNTQSLLSSPQLEGFKARGIEVLLLSDDVDDFWTTVMHEYKDHSFISVTASNDDLDSIAAPKDDTKEANSSKKDKKNSDKEALKGEALDKTIAFFKETLGDKVHDVISSHKLSSSPSCLSVQPGGMDIRMERFLVAQKQLPAATPKTLEINPSHALVKYISTHLEDKDASDFAWLLFEQACVVEGEEVQDTKAFAERMNQFLERLIA